MLPDKAHYNAILTEQLKFSDQLWAWALSSGWEIDVPFVGAPEADVELFGGVMASV